ADAGIRPRPWTAVDPSLLHRQPLLMSVSWRRWLARLIAVLLGPPLALLAALVGGVIVLLYSPPGLALTARFTGEMVSSRMAGDITIGSISGGIFRHIVL